MTNWQPDHHPRRGYGGWIAASVLTLAVAGCAAQSSQPPSLAAAPASSATQAAAQPETEAGVRDAATRFYALYSADQWAQAWQMLTPAAQAAAPEALYIAVHQGCPSASAGIARVIKSVTMADATAVVTEALSGVAGALGSATDAWEYSGGRWGIELSQTAAASYTHGSAAADIAAAKAAGECAGTRPQPLQTLPTVAPVTVAPPAMPTLATLQTMPVSMPTFAPPSPLPTEPLPTAAAS